MKISKNFQHLRIIKDGLPAESVVIILLILFNFLCVLPILWLSSSNVDGWFALSLFIPMLLILGLAFYLVIGLRICIEVDANLLTVRHEPVSLGNNKELPSKTIKLIYYDANRFYSPVRRRGSNRDSFTIVHKVYAITNGDETVELLSDLESKGEALFIVKEINQFLHLGAEPTINKSDQEWLSGLFGENQ
jgi:hypothetical protein